MEENGLNINEIVKVEKLPEIFYQLEVVGKQIDKKIEDINKLEVNEDTCKEIKKVRTSVNNTLKAFEERRKLIQKEILKPYEEFNKKYELEVKLKLQNASNTLGTKINDIESKLNLEKANTVSKFINEYIVANHLENIIDFDSVVMLAKLKFNLTTSVKSLKDDSLKVIERITNEVKLIDTEEQPMALLYEYKNNGYDLVKAKLSLIEKQKQIEELSQQREKEIEVLKKEEKVEEKVEEIIAPVEIKENEEVEEIIEIQFTIKTTKSKAKKVKDFLLAEGIEYE